ncbi:MAG: inner membrane-spanning protein YciB [Myxococcota bacterium]
MQPAEWIPLLAFFVSFQIWDLYVALAVLMVLAPLGLVWQKVRQKKSPTHLQLGSTALLLLFGGITLLTHNELFVKWKPTIFFWVVAIAFFVSHFVGSKPLFERLLQSQQLQLPQAMLRRLNLAWSIFFACLGAANLAVAYSMSTPAWVNFKVFGTMGLLAVFTLGQAMYIGSALQQSPEA